MATTAPHLYGNKDTLWSPDRTYRYFLRRRVEDGSALAAKPPIGFILLNPSTADETKDDPTVRRCRRYALAWGYGEVIILNAFAFRATDPALMRAQADPVGPDNDRVLRESATALVAHGGALVCGWGNHGAFQGRGTALRTLLRACPAQAFPHTRAGEPGHPLYLRKDVHLETLQHD